MSSMHAISNRLSQAITLRVLKWHRFTRDSRLPLEHTTSISVAYRDNREPNLFRFAITEATIRAKRSAQTRDKPT